MTKYTPEYDGIVPGPESFSTGHYKLLSDNVASVMTELVMGRLPIIFSAVKVSLPVRGTHERGFPWTAQFEATNSKTNKTYQLGGIIDGNKAVVNITQDSPFKWGKGDILFMYAMYIYEGEIDGLS